MVLLISSAVPGGVLAATPAWHMTVTPNPATVSAGADAGYTVRIFNDGKSNISQVFLTDALDKIGTTDSAIPREILPTTYVSQSQGSCDPAGVRLACALGAIRAGNSATVIVAFSTGANTTLQRIFEANTTGVAGDKTGSSHGDVLQEVGTTGTGSGPDFAGRFIVDQNLVVNDSLTLGADNLQSTKVNAPKGAIGVSVKDGTFSLVCPVACWSQTSEISVGSGALFASGFSVEIGIYKDLSQTVHGVYHEFDAPHLDSNGNPTILGETITATCPKNGTPSAAQIPCFRSTNIGGGNILVTVWLKENGKIGNF